MMSFGGPGLERRHGTGLPPEQEILRLSRGLSDGTQAFFLSDIEGNFNALAYVLKECQIADLKEGHFLVRKTAKQNTIIFLNGDLSDGSEGFAKILVTVQDLRGQGLKIETQWGNHDMYLRGGLTLFGLQKNLHDYDRLFYRGASYIPYWIGNEGGLATVLSLESLYKDIYGNSGQKALDAAVRQSRPLAAAISAMRVFVPGLIPWETQDVMRGLCGAKLLMDATEPNPLTEHFRHLKLFHRKEHIFTTHSSIGSYWSRIIKQCGIDIANEYHDQLVHDQATCLYLAFPDADELEKAQPPDVVSAASAVWMRHALPDQSSNRPFEQGGFECLASQAVEAPRIEATFRGHDKQRRSDGTYFPLVSSTEVGGERLFFVNGNIGLSSPKRVGYIRLAPDGGVYVHTSVLP